MTQILDVKSISKAGDEDRKIINSISFQLLAGNRLAIVGETGSGKSTLLKMIGGILEVDSGEVLFKDEKVDGPSKKLVPGHTEIKYLSQHFELPKFISVREFLDREGEVAVEDPDQIYKACRIENLLERDTRALSGGEKQRVALTKELLKAPEILLLDEPFSNLDFNHKRTIREVLDEIENDLAVTIILVAHDPKDVLSWADKVMVLRSGEVAQFDTPEVLYEEPSNEYVAGLFGSYSFLEKENTFLRPHHIQISTEKKSHQGQITNVRYFGSYDELFIDSEIGQIITNVEVGTYEKGQTIKFVIKK